MLGLHALQLIGALAQRDFGAAVGALAQRDWLHTHARHQTIVADAHRRAAIAATLAPVEDATGPSKPRIPLLWSAKVNQSTIINGQVQATIVPLGDGRMVEDTRAKRKATFSAAKFPWAPASFVGSEKEWMNFTTFFTSDYMGFLLNGQPLDASIYGAAKFSATFGWLIGAHAGGMKPYNGSSFQSWRFDLGADHFELLADAHGVPVYSVTNVSAPGLGNYTTIVSFSGWRADASQLPDVWVGYNETAFKEPEACPPPSDPTPVDTPIFIFHPKNNFDIAGQDVGDGTGDVFFVCVDVLTNKPSGVDHHYQWLTSWTVHHNPHLGQYQNCNGYPPKCLGANDFLVGHEAAQGLGAPFGGMCETNGQTGEWWSLPVGGECKGGATPEGGTCTWKATRQKTIDSKCLLDQLGFKEACKHGGRAPFEEATKIFYGAFAHDEPGQGGCPPLNVSVMVEQAQ